MIRLNCKLHSLWTKCFYYLMNLWIFNIGLTKNTCACHFLKKCVCVKQHTPSYVAHSTSTIPLYRHSVDCVMVAVGDLLYFRIELMKWVEIIEIITNSSWRTLNLIGPEILLATTYSTGWLCVPAIKMVKTISGGL